jgi:deoxyribonuclease V
MFRKTDPQWAGLVEEWKATQAAMRERMVVRPLDPLPRFVAGADAAFSEDQWTIYGVEEVYVRDDVRFVEVARAVRTLDVPYVPGFLSFREGPAVIDAIRSLRHEFGAVCFDGHGYAHPRRCGLASHVSITLDVPGVGVAKSRFIGTFDEPPPEAGSTSPLIDRGEQIGSVLRTRTATRPVFISVGHRVDLVSAERLAIACCTRYRIPEPTRQADIEVERLKRQSAAAELR